MDAADLRKKTSDELKEELHGLLKEQFNLRIQRSAGHTERSHMFKRVRRDIARIKTVLNEKATTEAQS